MENPSGAGTLSQLDPCQSIDLRFKSIKNDLRLQGSFALALKRPTKIPEYSRSYQHGDPIHMIDWKAYSRSDQLIIQEKRGEASAQVKILLDLSDSMYWPEDQSTPSKVSYATRLALNLVYIHLKLGDLVELHLYDSSLNPIIFQTNHASNIKDMFHVLLENNFSKKSFPSEIGRHKSLARKCDIQYVLSDLLVGEHLLKENDSVSHKCFIHCMSSRELSVDWLEERICYFDESSTKNEYLGSYLRKPENYLDQIKDWLKITEKSLRKNGWEYLKVTEQTKIESFYNFLGIQASLKKGIS